MRVVDLAPMCSLPPRDGADRRVWHLYQGLASAVASSRLIGRKMCFNHDGVTEEDRSKESWRDRKLWTGLVAGLTGRDYWQLRMLSPWVQESARQASQDPWDGILLNFLYSAPLLRAWAGSKRRLVVDTHNYDPSVFGGFASAAKNPLQRMLGYRAIKSSRRTLAWLPAGTVMVHVSDADRVAWSNDRKDLQHEVVENGCTVQPRSRRPTYGGNGRLRLLFVGSLSAQMNINALEHFAEVYWPGLKELVTLTVAGSRPAVQVTELCRGSGWELCPDISDPELEDLYQSAHYAVLPFRYGAGSKLKLFEACGRGVPVLSTEAGITGITDPPPLVTVADKMEKWREVVSRRQVPEDSAVEATLAFAALYAWPVLAKRLCGIMSRAGEVLMPSWD